MQEQLIRDGYTERFGIVPVLPQFSDAFGHTPLSIGEKNPWKCHHLIIGTGVYGRLPVMKEVKREAKSRKVEPVVPSTSEAIDLLKKNPEATNAILHVTC